MKKLTRMDRERIFREVLASVLGSKLRLIELRQLAELLDDDRRFVLELVRAISAIASSPVADDYQEPLFVSDESIPDANSNGLADLAHSVIQRRRMSKSKLVGLLKSVAPNIKWPKSISENSAKEIVSIFLDYATTSQIQAFLDIIGMEVAQDPFLGGIADRGKV